MVGSACRIQRIGLLVAFFAYTGERTMRNGKGSSGMKRWNEEKYILVLYGVLACMAVALLLAVARTENVQVFAARDEQEQAVVEQVSFLETEDASAPAGVRQTYSWTLPEHVEEDYCLAFYTVHQYAEVYIDGQLMYSLTPRPDNRIEQTVGSNWVMLPLSFKDGDKEVRVEITPAYESFRGRSVTFYTGSYLRIYLNQLKKDLPQIVLSILAILIGAVFAGVSLINRLRRGRYQERNLGYLGLFSVVIGIWKLSDTRFSPLMFPRNPILLSHISLVMMLQAPVPLLLFLRSCSRNISHRLLDAVCLVSGLSGIAMVVLQASGMMDLRQSLPASHAVILLASATVMIDAVQRRRKDGRSKEVSAMTAGFLLCAVGALLDLSMYYVRGNSSGILYTLATFLIYMIYTGIRSSRELNYRARIDMHTGLYNKSCCSEQFSDDGAAPEATAVFMFDLNGLKRVNDTEGHEAGDTMIVQFADILRKNVPARAFVGRYGGDEFVAVLHHADHAAVSRVLRNVEEAVEQYNRSGAQVPISCAGGSALSTEHPGKTMRELLEEADATMYADKRRQYADDRNGD